MSPRKGVTAIYFGLLLIVVSSLATTDDNTTIATTATTNPLAPVTTGCEDQSDNCCDKHERCREWAGRDECELNPKYMLKICQLSCNTCPVQNGTNTTTHLPVIAERKECLSENCCDWSDKCREWAGRGECNKNPNFMLKSCQLSCNMCPTQNGTSITTLPMITEWKECLSENCCDRSEKCPYWAGNGECNNTPNYMLKTCQVSCNMCPTQNGTNTTIHLPVIAGWKECLLDYCCDWNEKCREWAGRGDCGSNPNFMLLNCQLSCNRCQNQKETNTTTTHLPAVTEWKECLSEDICCDRNEKCRYWAESGECKNNTDYMEKTCELACNTFCAWALAQRTTTRPPITNGYKCLSEDCCDQFEQCEKWAKAGDCHRDHIHMIVNCQLACNTSCVVSTAAISSSTDANDVNAPVLNNSLLISRYTLRLILSQLIFITFIWNRVVMEYYN